MSENQWTTLVLGSVVFSVIAVILCIIGYAEKLFKFKLYKCVFGFFFGCSASLVLTLVIHILIFIWM